MVREVAGTHGQLGLTMILFTRSELIDIRERANAEAKATPNGHWAVALHALADAADWCDAQRARAGIWGAEAPLVTPTPITRLQSESPQSPNPSATIAKAEQGDA